MQRRLTALVVGISKYPNGSELRNPANDAADVASALQSLGFSVIQCIDCTSEDIDRAIESFKDNLNSNDVGLFYFAGHAMQFKGENYLNAVDTGFVDEVSAKHSSIPLNQVIDVMDSCSNRTNLIILDACRDNPFVKAWNRSAELNGLAPVHAPEGTLIAFATSPGAKAKDGLGRNGRYTESLLKHINTPDVPVEDLFKRVRNSLSVSTKGEQVSWEHTSLTGDFFFNVSAGRRLVSYGPEATSDSLFALKPSTPVSAVIAALKSCNWYTQNPALTALTATDAEAADLDTLFVLGRNVYQAACGSAKAASAYIADFRNKTAGLSAPKQKAILDGMLFEVFFNSKGELRRDFKMSKFNELFELRKIPELAPSFELLSEVLLTYHNRFYVIPGKARMVSIDLEATPLESGELLITGVYFEGTNVLRGLIATDNEEARAYPIKYDRLIHQLSTDMVIPLSQMTVAANFDHKSSKLLLPTDINLSK